jgi:hypothetical protein
MSSPPHDPRPPISSFDEPIDDSGADEAEARRTARKSASALPDAAKEALRLRGLGFTIMPLPTNSKAPPPDNWAVASKNNPAVFLSNPGTHNYAVLPPPGCFGWDVDKDAPKTLEDVGKSLGIGLPETLVTITPNGRHMFYRWPEHLLRPRGPMFGSVVTRWPFGDEGQGYLVGPGSVVVQENGSLGAYVLSVPDSDAPISDLPVAWAQAALSYRPQRAGTPLGASVGGPLAEVASHYEMPLSVASGLRYEAIRGYTAHLYNRGLSSEEMWPLVRDVLAVRFVEPVSDRELRSRFRRAVYNVAERLGEPKAVAGSESFSSAGAAPAFGPVNAGAEYDGSSQEGVGASPPVLRAVPSGEFESELAAREPIAYLVPGWVPAAGLTVVAGHPKSMKSLAVLQMLGAFVAGGSWLERDCASAESVHVGVYLTREGSHSEMLSRVSALNARHGLALGNRLRFIYEEPIEFSRASYALVSEMLSALESEMSVLGGRLRVLLVLDPLRDLMPDGGDENEAKVMAVVKRWCRSLIAAHGFLSVMLVHHLRKSASGSTGLEMSGSGAMYGAVDSTVIWKARKDEGFDEDSDDEESESGPLVSVSEMFGTYRVETRGDAPFKGRWRFDQTAGLIVPGVGRQVSSSGRALPGTGRAGVLEALRGLGESGGTPRVVGGLVGVSEANARVQLNRLEGLGKVVREGGLRYANGFAPFQRADVILPVEDVDDDEDWVDPLHRL